MKHTIVTEGKRDVAILRSVLNVAPDDTNVKFLSAGGWSAADSLARSLLIRGDEGVALVVDADTIDPDAAEERKRFLNRSLREVRGSGGWRVFVFTPELESIFFEDRDFLETLVDREVTEEKMTLSHYKPRQVLGELLRGDAVDSLEEKLHALDLSKLRKNSVIADLASFIQK